jgi:hypothetical protein
LFPTVGEALIGITFFSIFWGAGIKWPNAAEIVALIGPKTDLDDFFVLSAKELAGIIVFCFGIKSLKTDFRVAAGDALSAAEVIGF